MKKIRFIVSLLIVLFFGSTLNITTSDAQNSTHYMYWAAWGLGKIQRINLDGSNLQDLVTGLTWPRDVAVDVAGNKMYWVDAGANKVQRANLDGTNVENLVNARGRPFGVALDTTSGKMYWSLWNPGKIQRANLDGTNVEDFVTGLREPEDIDLDLSGGKIYWTDTVTNKIQRANLDGSNIEDLVTVGLSHPLGLTLDVVGGKIYWTNTSVHPWGGPGLDKIQRANLDGTNVEDLVTTGLATAHGIALDVSAGKMYWADQGKIWRANLDGSNVEDIIAGIGATGIAIATPQPNTARPQLRGDINADGTVDVLDLVLVAFRLGEDGENAADVNGDKVVNIVDLVLVAGALGTDAAAPSLGLQSYETLTATDVRQWLTQAQHLDLTDATSQRGILMLEQLLAALIPKETSLLPNYPNPFNPETWIPYQLSTPADVIVHIYRTNGTLVRTLFLGHQTAGMYQSRSRAVYWDGRNNVGEPVASGVYFYTLTAGDFTATRKMLIRK